MRGFAMKATRSLLVTFVLGQLLAGGVALAADKTISWTTTWQASPEPPRAPVITLSGQTIRQVVRISVGGNRFRVRLSNEFGDSPLRIGAAHVAIAADGSELTADSRHAFRLDDYRSITLGSEKIPGN